MSHTPIHQLTLSADAAVDLQLHTTCSDGLWTPEQLIDYLVDQEFNLVAITDHDRIDTVASIQHMAAQKGLSVLAAVEMTTSWSGGDVDLLCFGFDPAHNELDKLARHCISARETLTREMYEELLQRGYTFPRQQEILAVRTGGLHVSLDLMILLHQHGYTQNMEEAGQILEGLEMGGEATNDLATVVDAAHRSGAVCIMAHPGRGSGSPIYDPPRLDQLRAEIPIDGVEAYYPLHTPEQIETYLAYARQHNLLVSAGSDCHGILDEQKPIKYRAELVRGLLERVGVRVLA